LTSVNLVRRRAFWIALSIGAAVAVATAIVVVVPRGQSVVPSGVVRGSELAAAAPAGPVAAVGEFSWVSPFDTAAYRVTVLDAAGAVAFSTFTSQPRVTMPRNQAARLAPGRYSWTVQAFDAQGRRIAVSRPQSFEITPQR
jgi:hypothetical protein